ncbi:MAG: hypothetical protein HXY28_03935 [Hydrogenophilaceae bacterium]|jgi:hypothetical protein|nr:hypothetical protein [Hydrogenophilaceae bacterium]
MDLKPGTRWKSAVCETEAVVVRPPKAAGELQCGGAAMIPHAAEKPAGAALSPAHAGGSVLGKRYADEASGLEVLCSKGGQGALGFAGRALVVREAKKLPSSD